MKITGEIARKLRPDVKSVSISPSGDLVNWPDNVPKPTQDEIDKAIAEIDLDHARTAAIERIEAGYRQALRSFDHADTAWDASDDSATVLRDLLNRLANGRGLPRGKDTVTLRDTTGAAHEMTADQVIDLGEAGSDHRDECLEIRLDLLDQVRSEGSVEAIEAIDWPSLD